jgi:hypothetical protein
MPSHDNPFPGMNPFLQAYWSDVHTRLVVAVADQLAEQLPDGLVTRTEESVSIAESSDSYRPDVAVVEDLSDSHSPLRMQESAAASAIRFTEPIVVLSEPETERWVEIREANGRLITAIEVLSPSNKSDQGWREYRNKQQDLLAAGVNLVEIDLIRGGQHVLAVALDAFEPPTGTYHLVCVVRQRSIPSWRREIYPCPLREPLPTIRVPLRPGDSDAALAIQPLIDGIYRVGRYWMTAHRRELRPPLPPEESAWVEERLKAAGLK